MTHAACAHDHPAAPRLVTAIKVSSRHVVNDGARTAAALRRHGAAAEPKIAKALAALWRDLRGVIHDADITGETVPPAWELAIREAVRAAVEGKLLPVIAGAAITASRHLRDEWRRSARKLDPQLEIADDLLEGWEWGGGAAGLRSWLETEAGLLITRITDAQLDTIRGILRAGTVDGSTVYQMASRIRETVGLLPAHADAVAAYRQALLDSGAAPATAERAAAREAQRLLTYRARNIARTETSAAWNRGMRESIEAGIASGDIAGDVVAKRWWVTDDERLCELCAPLDGMVVLMDEEFAPGVTEPPLHPSDRCVCQYLTLTTAEALDMGLNVVA